MLPELCPAALHARAHPQHSALSWSGRSIAWEALNNYVHSTARYLKEIAVRPEASILLVQENSPAYVIVLLALWRIGAVPCPVTPEMLPGQSAALYAALKPALVISARSCRKMWGQKARWADIEHVVAYGYNDSFLGSASSLDPRIDPDRTALLRWHMAGDHVTFTPLSHARLKNSPGDLERLLRALTTGETYHI